MAKRRTTTQQRSVAQAKRVKKEPKFTYAGFVASLVAIVVGFVAQMAMAVLVYPGMPKEIPSGWVGSAAPYNMVPSWLVFVVFPGAQIGMLVLIMFARRDRQGRRVIETGNAVFLVLLAALFTVLQASAFRLR